MEPCKKVLTLWSVGHIMLFIQIVSWLHCPPARFCDDPDCAEQQSMQSDSARGQSPEYHGDVCMRFFVDTAYKRTGSLA